MGFEQQLTTTEASGVEDAARGFGRAWFAPHFRPRLGLQRRFSLLMALALAVCLGVFAGLSFQALDAASQRELDERLLLAKTAATQVDHAISSVRKELAGLAASETIAITEQTVAALHDHLDIPLARLSVLDANGRVVRTVPENGALLGNRLLDDADVVAVLQTGQPSVSGLRDQGREGTQIVISVPVLGHDGALKGALSGTFGLADSAVLENISALQLGQTGRVQLVDDRGAVLEGVQRSDGQEPADRIRLAALVRNRAPYVGICHECHNNGQEQGQRQDVVAFAPLASGPFGVLLRQSADETFAAVADLRSKLIGFGSLLLLAGLLLAQLTLRSIVKPVETLTESAKRIARGDLQSLVPRVGQSEIAVLAEALDEMRGGLRLSREAAERWNEQLENNVAQRTKELSALLHSANSLAATLDVDVLLKSLLQASMDALTAADSGAVWLFDSNDKKLAVHAHQGQGVLGLDGHLGKSLVAGLVGSGDLLLCATAQEVANAALLGGDGVAPIGQVESCLGAVMATAGKRIGAIMLVSGSQSVFGETEARLLRAIAGQAAVAVENAQLYAEVRRHQAARGELLARLFGAQEEERRRIARELHDETSQALTAVVINLVRLRKLPAPARSAALDDAEQIVAGTLQEIHRLVYDLRPTMLDDLGLVPALEWYLEGVTKKAGLELQLDFAGFDDRLPAPVETALFRIVQEATTNVMRHAHASKIVVRLLGLDGTVTVSIEDDGQGFTVSDRETRGTGLLGIRERVALLHGTVEIVSAIGKGTKVRVTVPLHVPVVN